MSAHTKGPWTLGKRTKKRIAIDAKGGGWWRLCKVVVKLNGTDKDYSAEGLANARLIAAAPELLEALRQIASSLDVESYPNPCRERTLGDIAINAIAKAEPLGNEIIGRAA